MLAKLFIALVLPVAAIAQQLTIAQYLTNFTGGAEYTLNNAAAAASNSANAAWASSGSHTLFVPADIANGPNTGSAGSIFISGQAIDFRTAPNYRLLWDVSGTVAAIYENYNTSNIESTTSLHVRNGAIDAIVLGYYEASNGFVYVINKAFTANPSITDTLAYRGCTTFLALLTNLDLLPTLAAFPNITIYAPNNQAMANAASALSGLTTAQAVAVVQNHILAKNYYTTLMVNSTHPNVLGNTLTATVTPIGNGSFFNTIGGATLVAPSDNFIANGLIQAVDTVILPDPIPSTSASWSYSTTTSSSTPGTTLPGSDAIGYTASSSLVAFVFTLLAHLF